MAKALHASSSRRSSRLGADKRSTVQWFMTPLLGLCGLMVLYGVYAHESWGQYFRSENLAQQGEASKYALPWLKDCRMGGVGEIVNVNYGLGWDGNLYGQIVVHFNTMIHTKEMLDPYRIQRVLPSVVVHFLALALPSVPYGAAPATNHDRFVQAVYLFQYYNIALLLAAGWLWIMLLRRLQQEFQVSLAAQWMGFVLLFVNFALCKYYLYYPMLTDATAFFLSVTMLYCYWRGWHWGIFALVAASFFTWPLLVYQSGLLLLFPREPQADTANLHENTSDATDAKPAVKHVPALVFGALMAAFIGAMLYFAVVNSAAYARPTSEAESVVMRLAGLAAIVIAVAVALWPLVQVFPYTRLQSAIVQRQTFLNAALLAALVAVLWFAKTQAQNPSLQAMATTESFLGFHFNVSANKPFVWLVAHAVFFGALVPLFVVLYRRIIPAMLLTGLGNTFVVVGGVVMMCVASESRQMVSFLPNVALCVVLALQAAWQQIEKNTTPVHSAKYAWLLALVLVVNLVSTKLWMQENFEGMWKLADTVQSYTQFPMQRYFMNQGPWMNISSYLAQGAVVMLVIVVMSLLFFFNPTSTVQRERSSR